MTPMSGNRPITRPALLVLGIVSGLASAALADEPTIHDSLNDDAVGLHVLIPIGERTA